MGCSLSAGRKIVPARLISARRRARRELSCRWSSSSSRSERRFAPPRRCRSAPAPRRRNTELRGVFLDLGQPVALDRVEIAFGQLGLGVGWEIVIGSREDTRFYVQHPCPPSPIRRPPCRPRASRTAAARGGPRGAGGPGFAGTPRALGAAGPPGAAQPVLHRRGIALLAAERRLLAFHELRRALAFHPLTPETLAAALVPTLFWRDLMELALDPRAPPALRRAAEVQLAARLPGLAVGRRCRSPAAPAWVLAQLCHDPSPRG